MIDARRTPRSLMIRTALPVEAEAVAAVMVRARSTYYPDGLPDPDVDWTERWRQAIERPDGQVLCAVRDARLVGLASFRPPEGAPAGTVKLFQFHVDPGHWRGGIGSALHAACVEQWRADGTRTAALEVHVDNLRAQAFYARHGWVPDPECPDDGHLHRNLVLAVPGE
ncbi:GNAT family N-acetyltransferase [Streptomyces sp. NPDC059168]|uniref:GNAT family N-acetyltransferase n=1 Tax=Streptomyces sp. NPDC059168 TaxID=3346753 RepID=UPI0036B41B8F